MKVEERMIEVNVNGIFLTQSQASGIILKEKNGERTLPIVIGEYEAQSIALGLENIKPPRPITHDLTLSILESCGVTMDSVLITELKNSIKVISQSLNPGMLNSLNSSSRKSYSSFKVATLSPNISFTFKVLNEYDFERRLIFPGKAYISW